MPRVVSVVVLGEALAPADRLTYGPILLALALLAVESGRAAAGTGVTALGRLGRDRRARAGSGAAPAPASSTSHREFAAR